MQAYIPVNPAMATAMALSSSAQPEGLYRNHSARYRGRHPIPDIVAHVLHISLPRHRAEVMRINVTLLYSDADDAFEATFEAREAGFLHRVGFRVEAGDGERDVGTIRLEPELRLREDGGFGVWRLM